MTFSGSSRNKFLSNMEQGLDVLIIGGGITGAGIALDAVSRGLEVGLIEMQDFAAGTSSRSTKLVHGGLRYLKQFEVRLVAEVGKERAIVHGNAPHVTVPIKMLLPLYKGGTFGKLSTSIGLKFYDYLARVKKDEQRVMLNREETLQKESHLKRDGLIGSGLYVEYRTDDARLTIEVIKKAVELGSKAVNYVEAKQFIYEGGALKGVEVTDLITKKDYRIFAKKIINATGPWVDILRKKDNSKNEKQLILSKGVHLVFNKKDFPIENAIYFDNADGRMIFAIPRESKIYLGTTDTFYDDDIKNPRVRNDDIDYLIKAANNIFSDFNLERNDIESSWAGLRVLINEPGKSASEISRRDEIFISSSGLISIAGGKLTGYRKMAERIVDMVIKQLNEQGRYGPSKTKAIKLSGGDIGQHNNFESFVEEKIQAGIKYGLSYDDASFLCHKYGSNIDYLYQIVKLYSNQYNLPLKIFLTLHYGIEHEMVVTPLDYFNQRTGFLLFNREYVLRWKAPVIDYMAEYFHWDEEEKNNYTKVLESELI